MYASIGTMCLHAYLSCTKQPCDDVLLYESCDAILLFCQMVLTLQLTARICMTTACPMHTSICTGCTMDCTLPYQHDHTAMHHDHLKLASKPARQQRIAEHAPYKAPLLHEKPFQTKLSKQSLQASNRSGYRKSSSQRPHWSATTWPLERIVVEAI